jgi:hypothetical protein
MAQIVGYWDDEVEFEDGPFVLTNPCGNGFRIECQPPYGVNKPGCPCLPDISIYNWRHTFTKWGVGKTNDKELATYVVDQLNIMVLDGVVIRSDKGFWTIPGCE